MRIRKTTTEKEIRELLARGEVALPPLVVERVIQFPALDTTADTDTFVEFRWGDRTFPFVAECKRLFTPKAIADAAESVRRVARAAKVNPLVVVPYLAEEQLARLEQIGVSGLDLCGNGVLTIPGELLVLRT